MAPLANLLRALDRRLAVTFWGTGPRSAVTKNLNNWGSGPLYLLQAAAFVTLSWSFTPGKAEGPLVLVSRQQQNVL